MKTRNYLTIYSLIVIVAISLTVIVSCKKESVESHPFIVTGEVSKIGSTTARTGGTIIPGEDRDITARGTCWSTLPNPTVNDYKTIDGNGTGDFQSVLTGLLPNTSYHLRTYAIRNGTVIYGKLVAFKTEDVVTDIDGNTYNTINIGNQLWMADNLRTTRFANGDEIGTTTPSTLEIMYQADPIYQWAYDGNEKNAAKYGRLYTWYAVMDPRGICPAGWHLPSDAEWTEMENYLIANGYNFDGTTNGNQIAKSMTSSNEWRLSDEVGTLGDPNRTVSSNNCGFKALPAGYRNSEGAFVNMGSSGCWWSCSEYKTYNAFYRYLYSYRNDLVRSSYYEFCAVSVRCIKD